MSDANTQTKPPQGAALYVHWPFCKKKCPYCDFNSHVREGVDHAAWRAALLRELGYWQARAPELTIKSIFFGGGTPSLMEPKTVEAVIDEAQKLWPSADGLEITLEANPTSVEAEKFRAFAAAGVNRVSLGVQSLKAESLEFLGREHSAREAMKAIEIAAQHFARYSFDLIYALPGQSAASWEAELNEALNYARGHLSLYQLTIEENTAFHHAYHVAQQFALPEENLAADLYALTAQVMEAAGMPAYEISNYAASGQESQHNLCYWRGDAYIGIGPGAHGRINMKGTLSPSHQTVLTPAASGSPSATHDNHQRFSTRNLKSPERWLDQVQQMGHGLEEETALNVQERAEEKLLMGLRLSREGFRFARLNADERAYLDTCWADGRIEKFCSMGLLRSTPEALIATARGQLLLNRLIQELLA